jgi:hypothetical protein
MIQKKKASQIDIPNGNRKDQTSGLKPTGGCEIAQHGLAWRNQLMRGEAYEIK